MKSVEVRDQLLKNAYFVAIYMHSNATDVQPIANCAMHAMKKTILHLSVHPKKNMTRPSRVEQSTYERILSYTYSI